jgi:hypothetical protein
MRKGFTGSLAGLLVAVGLTVADDLPPEKLTAPTPVIPQPAVVLAAPVADPPPHPRFEPAVTQWTRLPPEYRCGPPPGVCPATPCPCDEPPYDRVWFRADYLIWWLRNDRLPVLATTGPAVLPAGVEGGNGTRSVLSGRVDHGAFSGGRFTAGAWLDEDREFGVEASYFVLGEQVQEKFRNTGRDSVLARPFFNVNANAPSSLLVSFPALASGFVRSREPTDFQGFEVNGRVNAYACWDDRVDTLAGVRYLNLDERLTVATQIVNTVAAPTLPGATISTIDSYRTRNEFYGGQVGAEVEFRRECWYLHIHGKLGLGDTHQELEITGGSTVTTPTGTFTLPGGVLTQASNIGRISRDHFAVVPEVGIDLGYQVTEHIRVSFGYQFLFWNNVIRPGGQVDPAVDVAQSALLGGGLFPAAGLRRPQVLFKQTDLWVQGLNVTAEVRY